MTNTITHIYNNTKALTNSSILSDVADIQDRLQSLSNKVTELDGFRCHCQVKWDVCQDLLDQLHKIVENNKSDISSALKTNQQLETENTAIKAELVELRKLINSYLNQINMSSIEERLKSLEKDDCCKTNKNSIFNLKVENERLRTEIAINNNKSKETIRKMQTEWRGEF